MTARAALALALAATIAGARAEAQTFRAGRARVTRDAVVLCDADVALGDAALSAGTLRVGLAPGGALAGDDVALRPCRCLPVAFAARRAERTADGVLALTGARLVVGGAAVPLAPRWWVLWGERVGLLAPRLELRDGPAAGLGLHVPLGADDGADVWALGRATGADFVAEVSGAAGALRVVGRAGGTAPGVAARGVLAAVGARGVAALRADGATGDAAGRAAARHPVEALRAGHEVAFGALREQGGVVVASALEVARRGDDVGARTLAAVAAPDVARGRAVVAARAHGGQWLGAGAQAFGGAEARATARARLWALDATGYARGEVLATRGADGARTAGVGRAGAALALDLGRRYGAWRHELRWALGLGAEGGTEGARLVADATATSALARRGWRWELVARGLLATDALPPRVEARTALRGGGLEVEARVAADVALAALEGRARWHDPRGHGVEAVYVRRARSPWDAAPSWSLPAAGPLDLEGARRRRRPGESVQAAAWVALGRALVVRGDGAVDAASGALALAGGAVRLRAACGCAWLDVAAFWVRGGEVVGVVSGSLGGG